MDTKKISYFKNKLLEIKTQILNSGIMNDYEDLHVTTDDLSDEADLASSTINQQVSFSIRNREMAKLRRIEAALLRVEEGTYGICIESGEEIEDKRLETQPWAEYCLEVAEEFEREEFQKFKRQA